MRTFKIFVIKALIVGFLTGYIVMFTGCVQQTAMHKINKSYKLNEIQTENVGNIILRFEIDKYIEHKQWLGPDPKTGDRWRVIRETKTADSYKEELIYTGRSGSTVHISYREYWGDFARPAFYQELRYDLETTDIIVFRNYRIRVFEATSEYIKFLVLDDK